MTDDRMKVEQFTITTALTMYERVTVPPDVEPDDFGRELLQTSFVAGSLSFITIARRLLTLPDWQSRIGPWLEQLESEGTSMALKLQPRKPD